MHSRIHFGLRVLAPVLAVVASFVVPSLAVAGQYTVTFDAYANLPAGCEIWTMNGSTTFGYDPP